MKIWIRLVALCFLLSGCAQSLYREEFSLSAPFEAYDSYIFREDHPFDAEGDKDPALIAAIRSALDETTLVEVAEPMALARTLVILPSFDIEAGRRRILTLAANRVIGWRFQFRKEDISDDLVALEVFERQTGNLIYRVEAYRQETPALTAEALLSGFPPSAVRSSQLRRRLTQQ